MKAALILTLCFASIVSSTVTPTQVYSEEDLELVAQLMKNEIDNEIAKVETYQARKVSSPKHKKCKSKSDCANGWECVKAPLVLYDVLNHMNSIVYYEDVRVMLGIDGDDEFCVNNTATYIQDVASRVANTMLDKYSHLSEFINMTTGKHNLAGMQFFSKINFESKVAHTRTTYMQQGEHLTNANDIVHQQVPPDSAVVGAHEYVHSDVVVGGGHGMMGGGNDLMQMILLLTLFDTGSEDENGDSGILDLLIFSMLLGDGGNGGGIFENPLFMIIFLLPELTKDDENEDEEDNGGLLGGSGGIMEIILLMSVLDGSLMGGQAGAEGLGSLLPLLLISELDSDEGGISDIIPLLFLFQSPGGQGGDLNSILPLLLLGDSLNGTDNFLTTFILINFLFGNNNGMDADSLMPLMLVLLTGQNNSLGGDNVLFLILIMSMFSSGSDDFASLLPFIILLGDGGMGGIGGDSGSLSLFLVFALMSGQGNCEDGLSGILLPLMVMGDMMNNTSDMGLSDLILILALSGDMGSSVGGGMLNSFLPIILLSSTAGGSGDAMDPMILVLFLMMGGNSGLNGCHHDHVTGYHHDVTSSLGFGTVPLATQQARPDIPPPGAPPAGISGSVQTTEHHDHYNVVHHNSGMSIFETSGFGNIIWIILLMTLGEKDGSSGEQNGMSDILLLLVLFGGNMF